MMRVPSSSVTRLLTAQPIDALGLLPSSSNARLSNALDRMEYAHAYKHHGTAIFGGLDQHMNGKPPFLAIAL
jgi:hypothetical protein